MAAAKAAGVMPAATEATMTVSRPGAGGVAMVKKRVELDLGQSRKSGPRQCCRAGLRLEQRS
jgi:hypothetical protein